MTVTEASQKIDALYAAGLITRDEASKAHNAVRTANPFSGAKRTKESVERFMRLRGYA